MTTSHSSMHDLTSSSRDEMSSSLPAPPGTAPPPPHPDSARPMSPSRPHSIVGFLSDTSLPPRLLSPPPPPPLTSPPSFTSSLPRPPKNKVCDKLKIWTVQIINLRRACAARVMVVVVCVSVGQSVPRHLSPRAINCSTNNTTYSASDKGRKICRIFSETAAFGSYGVKTK